MSLIVKLAQDAGKFYVLLDDADGIEMAIEVPEEVYLSFLGVLKFFNGAEVKK